MNVDTRSVSVEQLGEVVDMLEEFVATRADLGELADAVEEMLPALVAKAAAATPPTVIIEPAPRISWRLTVERDPATQLITGAVIEPEDLQ